MFLKSAIKQVFFIIFILTFNFAHAAWWGQDKLPTPINTREIKQEKRLIAGAQYDFIYYESTQGADQIKDFYRKRMANLGWEEKSLIGAMASAQGIQLDSYVSEAMKQNFIFEKKDENVVLTIMPATFSQDGITRFSVARGKIGPVGQTEENPEPPMALLTQPKKEIAPVYPDATLLALSEGDNYQKVTYLLKDDIEKAVWFYKSQMSEYGWLLEGENPAQKIVDEVVTAEAMLKACPSCSKETFKNGQAIEAWGAQLFFANQKKDVCNIDFSEVLMPAETGEGMESVTTIIINYEEKK